mmetsp:Transcript_9984/g.20247  ORF Transcript_9984/g.20247 Transcript_9984/m.20247 type:complete len:123 (+) Transcript_9984:147-515(+)
MISRDFSLIHEKIRTKTSDQASFTLCSISSRQIGIHIGSDHTPSWISNYNLVMMAPTMETPPVPSTMVKFNKTSSMISFFLSLSLSRSDSHTHTLDLTYTSGRVWGLHLWIWGGPWLGLGFV